jgi:CheY-like chemotaxis protein
MATKRMEILLVEDDEIDVLNVKRAFRKAGVPHPVSIASNGLEALGMLRGTRPDGSKFKPSFILLDLNMPQMGGIEFLEELRKDPELRGLQVFVLSTSNSPKDKKAAYEHNVSGYIVKPIAFENFVKIVEVLKKYWEICESE